MPTYEYACRDCGHHLEVVQSFKDAALTTCGVCDGRLRKVFSAAGVIFKGSGYYVTDSRNAKAAKAGAKSADGPGGAEKGGADKGEPNKTAAKDGEAKKTSSADKPAAASSGEAKSA